MLKTIVNVLMDQYGFKIEHINFTRVDIGYDIELATGGVSVFLRDLPQRAIVTYIIQSATATVSGSFSYEAIEDEPALRQMLWSVLASAVFTAADFSVMDSSP